MDGKKALLLLFIIYRLNSPTPVNAQEPSDEQNNLLKTSFTSDFEFTDNTITDTAITADNSMDGVLLAAGGGAPSNCCCNCGCDYCCNCDCQCMCECVAHCDSGTHPKDKYHFYDFKSETDNLKIKRDVVDTAAATNYVNNFIICELGRAHETESEGIQYKVYTPIFNLYTNDTSHATDGTYSRIPVANRTLEFSGNIDGESGVPANSTATYYNGNNTVEFYTSKYTKKVQIRIAGDTSKDIDLVRGDVSGSLTLSANAYVAGTTTAASTITEMKDISCTLAEVTPPGGHNGDMIKWTFNFKLKTYGLFNPPQPNDPSQSGTISLVDAWDFNNASYSAKQPPNELGLGNSEVKPVDITFNVRQPKFNNFKVLKVDDIYWKGAAIPAVTGTAGKPVNINSNNKRHISMGYILEFSIDSTDFDDSQFKNLTIIPKFYCNNQQANLFYDNPSNPDPTKRYKRPVYPKTLENQQYAEISLDGVAPHRTLAAEKIVGTSIIKKEILRDAGSSITGKEDKKTWKFIYYLPPSTKAFIGTDKKTGLVEVRFDIKGTLDNTGQTVLASDLTYDFSSMLLDEGGLTKNSNVQGVFYYNLDWNALNDYGTQQR